MSLQRRERSWYLLERHICSPGYSTWLWGLSLIWSHIESQFHPAPPWPKHDDQWPGGGQCVYTDHDTVVELQVPDTVSVTWKCFDAAPVRLTPDLKKYWQTWNNWTNLLWTWHHSFQSAQHPCWHQYTWHLCHDTPAPSPWPTTPSPRSKQTWIGLIVF